MLKEEFAALCPGEEENYKEANALYMALPNTRKEAFAALWQLDRVTRILAPLRNLVARYDNALVAGFDDFLLPVHETSSARRIEADLKKVLDAIKTAAATANL